MPSRSGDLLRGRRRELAAAAARRVGAGEQVGDLVPCREALEDVRAERSRRGDGEAHLAQDGLRPQRAERFLAVLGVGPVDDQHAVEMVELVLDDPRGEPLELVPHVLAGRDPCPRA